MKSEMFQKNILDIFRNNHHTVLLEPLTLAG